MISKKDVIYIASLTRLHLEEHEIERLTKNLEDILLYVKKLEELDVSKVEPTSHVLSLENVFREDEVKDSLTQKRALSFAISQQDGAFKVPQIIE